MRGCTDHNNRKAIKDYWRETEPEPWPKEAVFTPHETQLWPGFKAIPEDQATSNGKLIVVSGLKYGLRVGYGKELISPKLGGVLAKLLAETADRSLASSTWSSYMGVLNKLRKISRETGVSFSYLMSFSMVQTLVAWLMKRGLKSR